MTAFTRESFGRGGLGRLKGDSATLDGGVGWIIKGNGLHRLGGRPIGDRRPLCLGAVHFF